MSPFFTRFSCLQRSERPVGTKNFPWLPKRGRINSSVTFFENLGKVDHQILFLVVGPRIPDVLRVGRTSSVLTCVLWVCVFTSWNRHRRDQHNSHPNRMSWWSSLTTRVVRIPVLLPDVVRPHPSGLWGLISPQSSWLIPISVLRTLRWLRPGFRVIDSGSVIPRVRWNGQSRGSERRGNEVGVFRWIVKDLYDTGRCGSIKCIWQGNILWEEWGLGVGNEDKSVVLDRIQIKRHLVRTMKRVDHGKLYTVKVGSNVIRHEISEQRGTRNYLSLIEFLFLILNK